MKTTILFGLDGASYTVLDDLVRRGVMPYLGEFISSGTRATMMSVKPPLTPPAWTSLVTGRSPGHHGVTGFYQYDAPESLSVQIISSRQMIAETIWSMVNRQGKRAGCLNFVAHQPAPKIDGWVIPGWVSWRWLKRLSHPPDLIDRLKQDIPELDVKVLAQDSKAERKAVEGKAVDMDGAAEWIGMHIRRERQWFSVMKHQLLHDPVDLVGIVFDGVDKLQHLFWPYLDPRLEPAEPSADFLHIRDLCWQYFRTVDELLAETVEVGGPDCTILVCSDHGFTATRELLFINTWLAEQGLLAWKDPVAANTDETLEMDPPRFYELWEFDLERTKAYALTGSNNGIHIPVRGRKGDFGIPPEEYESFRQRLIDLLLTKCVDPATGERLITNVWTREEIFAGPKMEVAPDLTIAVRDFGFFSVRQNSRVLAQRPVIIGTHHPEGVLIARGPGIKAGATIDPVTLLDVTPTALYAMGLEIPGDLEGDVVEELFTSSHRSSRKAKRGEKTIAVAAAVNGNGKVPDAQEEEEEIIARMKALGYIE